MSLTKKRLDEIKARSGITSLDDDNTYSRLQLDVLDCLLEIDELKEAAEAGLRGLVWFIEGPYGESPTGHDLKTVRAVLRKYSK